MTSRTKHDEAGDIDELYRNHVGSVHFEMIEDGLAFLRIGEERFHVAIWGGKLILKPE